MVSAALAGMETKTNKLQRLALLILWLTPTIFCFSSFWQMQLVDHKPAPEYWSVPAVVFMISVIDYVILHRRPIKADPYLVPIILFLSAFGLVLVHRLEPSFLNRQLAWFLLASSLLLAILIIPKDLSFLHRYKYLWLLLGLILLGLTLFTGVNPEGGGPRLWLQMGVIYLQPSEPLRLLLLIFLAGYFTDRMLLANLSFKIGRFHFPHPSYLGPLLLMWGFSIALLIWQKDLGAATLFLGTFVIMLYIATADAAYIFLGGIQLLLAGAIGYKLFDHVVLRIDAWLNPWADASGRSFQIVQSLIALASGGIFGQGLSQGLPTAIPVVHTDFVFAAIAEEFGLAGSLGIVIVFAILVSRAFTISSRTTTMFRRLLAAGAGTILGLQTLVIMAGTLKLIPLTGITLPFVSYGGSSLVTSYLIVAILLKISTLENGRA
jgi:cell division protein FtsW (lipid II flippase)